MTLSVDKFRAKLVGGGARANLFRVTLNFPASLGVSGPDLETVSYMCKAASLPASELGEINIPFRGRVLPLPGDRKFPDWDVTVINDTNFLVKNLMERWSSLMNQHSANTGETDPSLYVADLKVEQLNKKEEVIKTYIFQSAWPKVVSAIDLSNETTEAIEDFKITWKYLLWTSNTTDVF